MFNISIFLCQKDEKIQELLQEKNRNGKASGDMTSLLEELKSFFVEHHGQLDKRIQVLFMLW